MRWVALAGLVRAETLGDGHQRLEVPLSGGRMFRLDNPDFRELASDEHEAMTFDRALLFLRHGRRVVRKSWSEAPLGNLQLTEGSLHWSLDDSMTAMLPGEDLLANDWVVLP